MRKLVVLMLASFFFLGIAAQGAMAGTLEDMMNEVRDAANSIESQDPGNVGADDLEVAGVDKGGRRVIVSKRSSMKAVPTIRQARKGISRSRLSRKIRRVNP